MAKRHPGVYLFIGYTIIFKYIAFILSLCKYILNFKYPENHTKNHHHLRAAVFSCLFTVPQLAPGREFTSDLPTGPAALTIHFSGRRAPKPGLGQGAVELRTGHYPGKNRDRLCHMKSCLLWAVVIVQD